MCSARSLAELVGCSVLGLFIDSSSISCVMQRHVVRLLKIINSELCKRERSWHILK
jgi:hypothetical protein